MNFRGKSYSSFFITLAIIFCFAGRVIASPGGSARWGEEVSPPRISPSGITSPLILQSNIPVQSPAGIRQISPVFQRYTVEDGLSHSTINCILQDQQGFMWFGTDDGLNRFDGYEFKVYRNDPDDPDSLSHNMIMGLVEDSQGNLWIGTYGGGLDRLDPGRQRFYHYSNQPGNPKGLRDNRVRSLMLDQSGTIWIATHGGGVNIFNPTKNTFDVLGPDPENPDSAAGWFVDSIYEAEDGRIWIGSNDLGLFRYERETNQMSQFVHEPEDGHSLASDILLSSIVENPSSELWVGSFQGLNVYSMDDKKFTRYMHDPSDLGTVSHDTINALMLDHTGNIWIATADGLNSYDAESDSFISYRNDPSNPKSLSGNLINALYEDHAGDLWIGTRGSGLNRLDHYSNRFQHVYSWPGDSDGMNNNIVNAILEDQNGVVWLGTFGGGLNRWDRASDSWSHYLHDPNNPQSLSHDVVTTIFQDEQGAIWLGTLIGKINRFDQVAETFEQISFGLSGSVELTTDAGIRSMIQDHLQVVWIGTHGDGLYSLDPEDGSFFHYQHDTGNPRSLSDDWIYALLEDTSGTIWVGTRDAGLNKFNRSTSEFSNFVYNPDDPYSLGKGAINVIFQDSSGILWVGTEGGGLNRMDSESGSFVRYGTDEGFPSGEIYGIQEDEKGWMWISTGNGLVKFDPLREIIKTYDRQDGLQGDIFLAGSSEKAANGEIFFGGFNGMNFFDPEEIIDNKDAPPMILTSLTQAGKPMALEMAVERLSGFQIKRPDSYFEFEFAALNYNQADKNQYMYRLEGYDEDWVEIGTQRFGIYANLPAGSYILRILGANNDGVWNEMGLSLTVNVLPATWETWWFWSIIWVVVIGLSFTAYRFRIRTIEARSRQLEQQVVARTRELEAINAVGGVVSRSLDLSTVLENALVTILEYTNIQAGAICLYPENGDSPDISPEVDQRKLEVEAQVGFDPLALTEIISSSPFSGVSMETEIGHPDKADPIAERSAEITRGGGSMLAIPLIARKRTLGYLFGKFPPGLQISEQEQDLLAYIGMQIGVAIENARLYSQSKQVAVVEERQRLARDLHDSITQALYGVILFSDAAAGQLNQGQVQAAQEHIHNLRETAQQGLGEMRLLIHELRPVILENEGLEAAIAYRLETVESRAGLKTRFRFEVSGHLDTKIEEGLYRITLEALNNVLKHAHAREVLVSLRFEGESLLLEVRDDGVGFRPEYGGISGLGLPTMRERAVAIGGSLRITSSVDEGTSIQVEVPNDGT